VDNRQIPHTASGGELARTDTERRDDHHDREEGEDRARTSHAGGSGGEKKCLVVGRTGAEASTRGVADPNPF
jgi:hypothetical protein